MLSYRKQDHAVHIANDLAYGLVGAVARRMGTGQIDINGGRFKRSRRPAATSSRASARGRQRPQGWHAIVC